MIVLNGSKTNINTPAASKLNQKDFDQQSFINNS